MTDVKKIADDIFNTIQQTIAEAKLIDKGDGFDLKDVRAVINTIDLVLTEVEKLSKDVSVGTLTGEDKKAIAVDLLTRLLSFDIPWVPNFLEGKVKSYAINFAIDYSVQFLNKRLGKEWLQ